MPTSRIGRLGSCLAIFGRSATPSHLASTLARHYPNRVDILTRVTQACRKDTTIPTNGQNPACKFSPVKSPVRSPSWPYLHVLRQSPTVSKLLEVWNHGSVSRWRSNQLSYAPTVNRFNSLPNFCRRPKTDHTCKTSPVKLSLPRSNRFAKSR
jgi:hypothetical protein